MLDGISKAHYAIWACVVVGLLSAILALFGCSDPPASQEGVSVQSAGETAAQRDGEVALIKLELYVLTPEQANFMYVGAVDYTAARTAGLVSGPEFSADYLAASAAYMAVFNAYLCETANLGSYQDNLDSHPWRYSAEGIDEALKQNGGFGRSNVFIRNAAYVERLSPEDLKLLQGSIEGGCVMLTEDVLDMVAKTYPTVLEVRNESGEKKSSVVYRDTVFDYEIAPGDALVFVIAYEPEFDSSGALVEADYEQDKAEVVQAASEVMQYEVSKATGRSVAVFVENL